MPDNLLALNQHLPRFTGRETLENKVDQVARYEYELLETKVEQANSFTVTGGFRFMAELETRSNT